MDILAYMDKQKCSGCGACINNCMRNAIVFVHDENGFIYPHINEELCVDCGKCVSTCNYIQENHRRTPLKAFAMTHRDENVLMNSSSGGVFSALAEYVLEENGAVCGCVYDEDFTPIHICTEKEEEVLLMRKSKYAQSNVGLVYRDIKRRLIEKQVVLFVGTPCQVNALYAVLGKNIERLITVDLICHGVPSSAMFKKFLKYLELEYKTEICEFDFRSKRYGWPRYTAEFTDKNGKRKNIGKVNEFYLSAFTGGNIMRPSCFSCEFACSERVGDITIGDFWGYSAMGLPFEKKNGISVCACNSATAVEIIEILSEKFFIEEIDYQTAVAGNTCLRHPTPKGEKWDAYIKAFQTNNIANIAHAYKKSKHKAILRGKIKLLMPMWVIRYLDKRRRRK